MLVSTHSRSILNTPEVTSVLRGDFGLLRLFDIVHFVMTTRMTGLLTIENDYRKGYLEFNRGKLLSVGEANSKHSDEMACEFFQWASGKFEFRLLPVDAVPVIPVCTDRYLIEMAKKIDELCKKAGHGRAVAKDEEEFRSMYLSLKQKRRENESGSFPFVDESGSQSPRIIRYEELDNLLKQFMDKSAAVLYLQANNAPRYVRNGESFFLNYEVVSNDIINRCCTTLLGDGWDREIGDEFHLEVPYDLHGIGSFIIYVYREFGFITLVAQLVRTIIPDFIDLNLPVERLMEICALDEGLIIVAGKRKSGRSTTVASMLDFINSTRTCVLLTFEQTVEFKHQNMLGVVCQTKANFCQPDFVSAIQYGLKQKPDIIHFEQILNRRVAEIALGEARNGHLIIVTINADDCAEAIERFAGLFPRDQKSYILEYLSETLRTVIAQRLVPGKQQGLVPVTEIIPGTEYVSKLILEGDFQKIKETAENPPSSQFLSFAESIVRLRAKDLVE